LKDEPYTDESFPPNEFSLIQDWDEDADGIPEKARKWQRFTWIRATEIEELNDSDGKLQVFANSVDPSDIKQGDLGDCYFLSTLSVLAEKPKRITDLFLSKRENKYGIYGI
jgi:calpain-15